MHYCYILHSEKLDRFYVGVTSLPAEERLGNHLFKFYGNHKFTAKADDWVIFLSIECASSSQSRKIESHIKSMKSKIYITNLKQYPEMIQKLLDKYPDS